MSSVALYRTVQERGVYDIQELDTKENLAYQELCRAISTKDLSKCLRLLKSVNLTYTFLNQPIFICSAECCYENCIAFNLCHIAVYNDCEDILEELLKNGGDLSAKTVEVTVCDTQRTFIEKDSLIELIVRHFDEPIKFLHNLFDGCIETTDLGTTNEYKLDFSILYPSARMENDALESERQMCVLNEVLNSSYDIYSEECGLLQHPLIEAYLSCKWIHYRRFFYILVALHVLFAMCLSTIASVIVRNFPQLQNITVIHSEEDTIDVDSNLKLLNCLLFPLGVLLLTHALIQACAIPLRKLLFEFEVISNIFTAGFGLLICTYEMVSPLQWQLKYHFELMYTLHSVTILPAWINLMLIIGRIPSLGCYSLMFTTVMKNFLKVMVSFIFLIVGFALSFSLLFPTSTFFNNPFGAVLRTMVMMIGEMDYAETFLENKLFLEGPSKIIFILFLISCNIILMNLTQGIAVNDIKRLLEISQIIRLEKETRFLYEFECIFTQPMMTSNSILKKIKKRLYDNGAIKCEMIITKKNKQGISNGLLAKLVQDYKPTKTIWNRKLSLHQYFCIPNLSGQSN